MFLVQVTTEESTPAEVQELLAHYEDVFHEPQGLPPPKKVDHRIPLKHGTTPISLRPYHYPTLRKDVIEKMIGEMLGNGRVQARFRPPWS